MVRKYTPAEIIDIVADFQQKARESIRAWLGGQWMGTKGRDDGISLTGQRAKKLGCVCTHPLSGTACVALGAVRY